MFVPVPDDELSAMLKAVEEGRCCVCYGPITKDCGGEHSFYCHDCDDGCDQDEAGD